MKIVEVCGYYPPHNGGIEFVVKQVAEQLAINGHEVTVLTAANGHSPGTVSEGGVGVIYQRGFEFAHTTVTPGLFFRLLSLKKETVVHLHLSHVFTEFTVMIASIIKRFPYVAHYHMDVEASGSLGFLYNAYKRFLLPYVVRRANSLIALSEEQRDILVNRYGAEPERVNVIPNGVAEKFFIKKRRNFNRSPKRLLYVGRFAKQKNLERLLRAIPLLKQPVELHLVGDGEETNKLKLLAAEMRLNNVIFEGSKPQSDLPKIYAENDVFVLTSNREGMPLVLLEAAAAGLPIVASDVQGLREFISDNGILVKNPSPKKFAKAIDALIDDSKEMQRLSVTSKKWAAEHTWEKLTVLIEQVLRNAH